MNEQTAKYVNELSDTVLLSLVETLKMREHQYTEVNVILNILTGCLVKIMQKMPDEIRGEFVKLISIHLKSNLNHLRKKGV